MDSIRIENLRSLVNTEDISLKPITLLLGQNSSGKSTFLRCFPLLRQSIESRTSGPVLWYGRFVDFGSFHEAIWDSADNKTIKFHFNFKTIVSSQIDRFRSVPRRVKEYSINLTLEIAEDIEQNLTWTSGCTFRIENEHLIKITFKKDGDLDTCSVNNRKFTKPKEQEGFLLGAGLIPTFVENTINIHRSRIQNKSLFSESLMNCIKNVVHKNTSFITILNMKNRLYVDSSERMLLQMKNLPDTPTSWNNNVISWNEESEQFKRIRDTTIANFIPNLINSCNEYIENFFKNSNYIAPLRATAERYYRLQDLSVDEVDYQGQNLPMFLKNLDSVEFEGFRNWCQKNFGFSPMVVSSEGHISIKLKEEGSNKFFNLADKGFGFSQILPILTQLWNIVFQKQSRVKTSVFTQNRVVTFVIEQPELHLHPSLQALLMDAFIQAVKSAKDSNIDLRLIIETHSETMVNRLGQRVYNKDISAKDINVVLFEKREADSPSHLRVSKYDKDGFLTNWPFGFFEPSSI